MRVKYEAVFLILDQYLRERGLFRKCRLKPRENELIAQIRESLSPFLSTYPDEAKAKEGYVDNHFFESLEEIAKKAARNPNYYFSVSEARPASAKALVRLFLLYVQGYFEDFEQENIAKLWFGERFAREFAAAYGLPSSLSSRRHSGGSSETAVSVSEEKSEESTVLSVRICDMERIWTSFVRPTSQDFPAVIEAKELLAECLKPEVKSHIFREIDLSTREETLVDGLLHTLLKGPVKDPVDKSYFRVGLGLLRLQEPDLLIGLSSRWFLYGKATLTEKLPLFPLNYLTGRGVSFLNKFDPETLTSRMLRFLSLLEGVPWERVPEKFLTEKALEQLSALGTGFVRHYLTDLSQFSEENLVKYGPQLVRYLKEGRFERETPAQLFRMLNQLSEKREASDSLSRVEIS